MLRGMEPGGTMRDTAGDSVAIVGGIIQGSGLGLKASKTIRDRMTRFGLITRIGVNEGKLKTKAMCCPPTLEEALKLKDEAPGREEATFASTKDTSPSLANLRV
jgi:hypothetical protein